MYNQLIYFGVFALFLAYELPLIFFTYGFITWNEHINYESTFNTAPQF